MGSPARYSPRLATLDSGIAGDIAAAQVALQIINREALDDYSHRIQRLARAIVAIRSASREQRRTAWQEARRLVAKAAEGISVARSDGAFTRAYWRSNRCMATVGGRPWRLLYTLAKLIS